MSSSQARHVRHMRKRHVGSWPVRILVGLGGLVVLAGLAAAALVLFGRPQVHFSVSSTALADMRVGGIGTHIGSVSVTAGGKAVAVSVAGGQITPSTSLPGGVPVTLDATASAPSWLSWLVGPASRTSVTVHTPRAWPDTTVTLATGHASASQSATSSPLDASVHFSAPVSVVAYRSDVPGASAHVIHVQPPSATVGVPVPPGTQGGTLEVAGAPRSWETIPQTDHVVTWFAQMNDHVPAVVADPAPGASLTSSTSTISLVFSQTVRAALGTSRPTISPKVHGTWSEPSSHELVFTPSGFGFGPGTTVTVDFHHPVAVVGSLDASTTSASTTSASPVASTATPSAASTYSFSVRPASLVRLDQILAELHYLPLRFTPAPGTPTPTTMAGEEATMYAPLPGSFSWRYANVPPTLAAQWAPGQPTVMLKGALMAFEGVQGTYNGYTLDAETVDQIAGRSTWDQLLHAALAHQLNPNPYSYVYVTKTLPETLTLWQDGQVILTSPANTGIAQDPTQDGTFPIYLRFVQDYMSGTNPNGTTYHDLVHWINYFNGGDAVHGFVRAAYGFPQSLGCVELPVPVAAQAFPHLALGDLVTVAN